MGILRECGEMLKRALELADGVYDLTARLHLLPPTHAEGEPDPTPLFGFAAETGLKEDLGHPVQPSGGLQHPHRHFPHRHLRVHNGAAGAGPSMAMMDTFQAHRRRSISESGTR